MADWVSIREFARRMSVRHRAVQKAIDAGRVTAVKRAANGRLEAVDAIAAATQWRENTDPAQALRNGKLAGAELQLTPPAGDAPPAPADQVDAPAAPVQGDQANFLAARVREAELRGQLLELDKLERLGLLVPRALVRREFTEILTQLKSSTFLIPDRSAQSLAAVFGASDPTMVSRVASLLRKDLQTVFDEFSRQLDASAAGLADDASLARERAEVLP